MTHTTISHSANSADTIAHDVERKQNKRLTMAGAVSIAVNILFLVGAANGMSEKSLSLVHKPSLPFFIDPAPLITPEPEAEKPMRTETAPVKTEVLPNHTTPQPIVTPKPVDEKQEITKTDIVPIPIASVTPPDTTPLQPEEPPVSEVTPPDVVPVENPIIAPDNSPITPTQPDKQAEPQMRATSATEASSTAAMLAARGGGKEGTLTPTPELATPNGSPGGTPSLALGKSGSGRVAEGVAGASTNAVAETFAGIGTAGASTNNAPSLRPGASAGTNTLGVGGMVGEARGTTGTGGAPLSVTGPKLAGPTGPTFGSLGKSGPSNSILSQVNTGGIPQANDFTVKSGSGLKPGEYAARSGTAAGGNGDNVFTGHVARGGDGNGFSGSSMGTIRGNSGSGRGPGGGNGGPLNRETGIGTGTGTGSSGTFRVQGSGGKGADVDGNGTGTASGVGRSQIAIQTGGNGAGIQSERLGTIEGRGNAPLQVTGDGKGKSLSTPTRLLPGTDLPSTVDQTTSLNRPAPTFATLVDARILSRSKPTITDAMKEADLKKVVVEFDIATNGNATFRIVSGSGNADVDNAVLKACEKYRWQAAANGGKATASKQRITFDPKE